MRAKMPHQLHAETRRKRRSRFAAEFVSNKNRCAKRDDSRTDGLASVFDEKKLHRPIREKAPPHFRQKAPARFLVGTRERFVEGMAMREVLRAAFSRHQVDRLRRFSDITRQPRRNAWRFHRIVSVQKNFDDGKQFYPFRGLGAANHFTLQRHPAEALHKQGRCDDQFN